MLTDRQTLSNTDRHADYNALLLYCRWTKDVQRAGKFCHYPGRNRFLRKLLPKHINCNNIKDKITFYKLDSKSNTFSVVMHPAGINVCMH